MEERVGYAAAGLFVLVGLGLLIAAGLWIGADLSRTEYQSYHAYMEESVSGLSRGALVSYRGVEVGRVEAIRLDRDNPQRVRLRLSIRADAPVRTDTVATLRTQGLTGIGYVELSGGTSGEPLRARPGEALPVIETRPSLLTRVDLVLTAALDAVTRLSTQLEALLGDESMGEALARTLESLDRLSGRVAENGERVERSLVHLEQMLASGADVSQRLPRTVAHLDRALIGVRDLTGEVSGTNELVRELLRGGSDDAGRALAETLPELRALIMELRDTSGELDGLAEDLSREPSSLLRGRAREPAGPGE